MEIYIDHGFRAYLLGFKIVPMKLYKQFKSSYTTFRGYKIRRKTKSNPREVRLIVDPVIVADDVTSSSDEHLYGEGKGCYYIPNLYMLV